MSELEAKQAQIIIARGLEIEELRAEVARLKAEPIALIEKWNRETGEHSQYVELAEYCKLQQEAASLRKMAESHTNNLAKIRDLTIMWPKGSERQRLYEIQAIVRAALEGSNAT